MNKLAWNKDFTVEDDIIDAQHKKLIDLYNTLIDLTFFEKDTKKLKKTVSDLKEYSNYHFSEEENRMQKANYTHTEDHIFEHNKFKKQMNFYSQKINEGSYDIVDDMFLYLGKWIVMHIKNEDKKYIGLI